MRKRFFPSPPPTPTTSSTSSTTTLTTLQSTRRRRCPRAKISLSRLQKVVKEREVAAAAALLMSGRFRQWFNVSVTETNESIKLNPFKNEKKKKKKGKLKLGLWGTLSNVRFCDGRWHFFLSDFWMGDNHQSQRAGTHRWEKKGPLINSRLAHTHTHQENLFSTF